MNYLHILKKIKNGGQEIWIWIFIDRNRNKVIDLQVGDRTSKTFHKVFDRISNNYNINYFCTDGLEAYTTKRFSSIKDDKYINEEYYRKIDRRNKEKERR